MATFMGSFGEPAPPPAPKPDRARSSSRRRRIRAQVEARTEGRQDAWNLQQELLNAGAAQGLMDAARKLLQPEDYSAVVEERALEGICGFPPCVEDAVQQKKGKRFFIDASRHECMSMEELGQFCSHDCLKKSGGYALSLAPDPQYVRPASAVAASRAAVSEAKHGSGRPKQAVPEVRTKAVVRFSRGEQTYTVDCANYDEGGGIPGEISAATPDPVSSSGRGSRGRRLGPTGLRRLLRAPVVEHEMAVSVSSRSLDGEPLAANALGASKSSGTTASATALNVERTDAEPSPGDGNHEATNREHEKRVQFDCVSDTEQVASAGESGGEGAVEETTGGKDAQLASDAPRQDGLKAGDDDDSLADDDDDGGMGLYGDGEGEDGDCVFEKAAIFPGASWKGSPFVRAWGVLTSWLTDIAKNVITAGTRLQAIEDETKPIQQGRRALLVDLLMSRLPGDVAPMLGKRFKMVAQILGVHQSVPCVSEADLWDLLAHLLLRNLFACDVARGAIRPNPYCEGLLDHKVASSAKSCGIGGTELEQLQSILPEPATTVVDALD